MPVMDPAAVVWTPCADASGSHSTVVAEYAAVELVTGASCEVGVVNQAVATATAMAATITHQRRRRAVR